ncbi:CU044_2847 family protein [Streptomyces specialis]|uniref:CU044_2847 family protein n=1 Tax=Streptomyces specialis TaxID=498367 RepID=UPI00073F5358
MSSGITRISLPDGTPVWARISGAEQAEQVPVPGVPGPAAPPSGLGDADTGLADRTAARMESLRGLITGVAASVADGLRAARPDEVSVTFGIELTARAGKIVGLLADGDAKGAISVTLTWHGGPPEDLGSGGAV